MKGLFNRGYSHEAAARALYAAVVAQARQPGFYRDIGVPDSIDGRFELIVLHTVLVLQRLNREDSAAADLGQALFDTLFRDMDRSLREMGAGDLGVGKRVKHMAQGFYGRLQAYEAGLGDAGPALEEALRRNLYGTVEPQPWQCEAMAAYMHAQATGLAAQAIEDLLAGRVAFGAPPPPPGGAAA